MKRCPNCNGSIIRMGHKEKPFFCSDCKEWFSEPEVTPKQTNADRIRNMGDTELANYLSGLCDGCINCPMYDEWQIGTADECGKHCNSSWQNWVKRESEDE